MCQKEMIKEAIEHVHNADNNRLSQILGMILSKFEKYATTTQLYEAEAACEAIREAMRRLMATTTKEKTPDGTRLIRVEFALSERLIESSDLEQLMQKVAEITAKNIKRYYNDTRRNHKTNP